MAIGSPGIFPKSEGNVIYAADYNSIQSATEFLLGTGLADSGYGQTITSAQTTGGAKVTVSQWNNLRSDLLKIRQHQTGVDQAANLSIPTTDLLIDDAFANQYKDFGNVCNTNRLTIAANQGTLSDLFTPATRTTAWNGVITHTVTVTFASSNAARFFFNAGGQFRFSASRSGGTVSNKNTAWTTMLSDMGTITFNSSGTNYSGSGATTVATTTGWYGINTSNTTVFLKPSAAGVYVENDYNIQVRKDANDNTASILYFTIQFRDDDTGDQVTGGVGGGGVDGLFAPLGPAVDESVDGTLTSTVKLFLPTGTNVSLTAPSHTQSGI